MGHGEGIMFSRRQALKTVSAGFGYLAFADHDRANIYQGRQANRNTNLVNGQMYQQEN